MDLSGDHRIVEGISKRDDATFKYIQVKYQDSIRLMVMEMGGTAEDAKDVFSEGLIALIRLIDKEDFKLTCKLGTLIYALCKKKWSQQLEKQTAARNYHIRKVDSETENDFSEDYDHELYHEIFRECFEKLEQGCRDILEAYLKEIPPRDIAKMLGFSYGYVRKRKSMCHGFLMKMIEDHPAFKRIKQGEAAAFDGIKV